MNPASQRGGPDTCVRRAGCRLVGEGGERDIMPKPSSASLDPKTLIH